MDFLLLLLWPYMAAAAGVGVVAGAIGEVLAARRAPAARSRRSDR